MALRNARGNKSHYDYAHKTPWPVWERRQKWLGIGMVVGALLICAGLLAFMLIAK